MKKAAGHDGHMIKHTPASLRVLNYCLWAEVSRRMRQQEVKLSNTFRGPADAYMRHLKRTAMDIPESFVSKAVGSMRLRAAAIKAAEGGLINEWTHVCNATVYGMGFSRTSLTTIIL